MPESAPKAPAKKAEKKYADSKYKRRAKKLIGTLTFLLALSMAGLAGFWYYQNIYLQAIEKILISGTRDQLTVTVDTQIKDSMLTVTCSDSHGNSSRQPLSGGTAIFSDLSPAPSIPSSWMSAASISSPAKPPMCSPPMPPPIFSPSPP